MQRTLEAWSVYCVSPDQRDQMTRHLPYRLHSSFFWPWQQVARRKTLDNYKFKRKTIITTGRGACYNTIQVTGESLTKAPRWWGSALDSQSLDLYCRLSAAGTSDYLASLYRFSEHYTFGGNFSRESSLCTLKWGSTLFKRDQIIWI